MWTGRSKAFCFLFSFWNFYSNLEIYVNPAEKRWIFSPLTEISATNWAVICTKKWRIFPKLRTMTRLAFVLSLYELDKQWNSTPSQGHSITLQNDAIRIKYGALFPWEHLSSKSCAEKPKTRQNKGCLATMQASVLQFISLLSSPLEIWTIFIMKRPIITHHTTLNCWHPVKVKTQNPKLHISGPGFLFFIL